MNYQNQTTNTEKLVCQPNSDKPNESAGSDMSDRLVNMIYIYMMNVANLRVTNTQSQFSFIILGLISSKHIQYTSWNLFMADLKYHGMICHNSPMVDTNSIYDREHGICFWMKDKNSFKKQITNLKSSACVLKTNSPSIVDHLPGFYNGLKPNLW